MVGPITHLRGFPPPITTRLHYKVRSKIRTFYHLDNFLCLFFNSFINYGRIK